MNKDPCVLSSVQALSDYRLCLKSPLVEDAVEHQRKMDRYDRLMRDLRGKVRIGRKLTRDELNER